jgi:hypothetical protein
LGFPLTEV